MVKAQRIAILGGSGFLGSHLIPRLLSDGHHIKLLTRDQGKMHVPDILPAGDIVQGDPHDLTVLEPFISGHSVVINLVGILNERGRRGREFQQVHEELPRQMARICRRHQVRHVVHMSALGAQAGMSPSFYLRSKGAGNNAIMVELGNAVPWTIFQPSVIFGPDDKFVNRFAMLLKRVPGVFPLACPEAQFAPVFVEDVVEACARVVANERFFNKRIELCGPDVYSLRQIVEFVARQAGIDKRIFGLPDYMARMQASVMELLPGKPFSRDNYQSAQVASVCNPNDRQCLRFSALDIQPQKMTDVVPTYLDSATQSSG